METMDKATAWSQCITGALGRMRSDEDQFKSRFKSLSDENLYSLSAVDSDFIVDSDNDCSDYTTDLIANRSRYESGINDNCQSGIELRNQCGSNVACVNKTQVLSGEKLLFYKGEEADTRIHTLNQYAAAQSSSDTYSNNSLGSRELVAPTNDQIGAANHNLRIFSDTCGEVSHFPSDSEVSPEGIEQGIEYLDLNYNHAHANYDVPHKHNTDTSYNVRNIKSELGLKTDTDNKFGFVQTYAELDTLRSPKPPLEVDILLQEYARRKEARREEETRLGRTPLVSLDTRVNRTQPSNQDRVADNDQNFSDALYLDDGAHSSDKEVGVFPMTRYGKMSDLSDPGTCNDIDDILNQTLETIAEESDEEHDLKKHNIAPNLCNSDHANNTTDATTTHVTSLSNPQWDADKLAQHTDAFIATSGSDNKHDWDNELDCELADSVIMSESDNDYPDLRNVVESSAHTHVTLNLEKPSDPNMTSVVKGTSQQIVSQNETWYEECDLEDLPAAPMKIQWDKVAEGLYRPCLVDKDRMSDSTSTLCAEDLEIVSPDDDVTVNEPISIKDTVSPDDDVTGNKQISIANTDERKMEDGVDLDTSSTYEPDYGETHDITDSVLPSDAEIASAEREPFCYDQKVNSETDWDTVNLSCELTESVVLSDYVSDIASVASDIEETQDLSGEEQEIQQTDVTYEEMFGEEVASSEGSFRTPQGSIDCSRNSLPYYSPSASMPELYSDARDFTTPVHVDLGDTGYFSRSQDRDSEIDSLSSPPNPIENTSPLPDCSDQPMEGEPETEVPSRMTRIAQLTRRSSKECMYDMLKESAVSSYSSGHLAAERQSVEAIPETDDDKLISEATANRVSSDTFIEDSNMYNNIMNDSNSSEEMADGRRSSEETRDDHSSPSSDSVHEPHGDVESIKTAWYEDVEPNTPPVKSIKFAPFCEYQMATPSPDVADSGESNENQANNSPGPVELHGLIVDSNPTLRDKDKSPSTSESVVTSSNTLLNTLSQRKASIEESLQRSQVSDESQIGSQVSYELNTGSYVYDGSAQVSLSQQREVSIPAQHFYAPPQKYSAYDKLSMTDKDSVKDTQKSLSNNVALHDSPLANTEKRVLEHSSTGHGSDVQPQLPIGNLLKYSEIPQKQYTFTIDKQEKYKFKVATSMSDNKTSYSDQIGQRLSNQVYENDRFIKHSPTQGEPYKTISESVDSRDKSQMPSSDREIEALSNRTQNNNLQCLSDGALNGQGKYAYAEHSQVQANKQMDKLIAFQNNAKAFASSMDNLDNDNSNNGYAHTHMDRHSHVNAGGHRRVPKTTTGMTPGAMLISNNLNGDNIPHVNTNGGAHRENQRGNIGIGDKRYVNRTSEFYNTDETMNPSRKALLDDNYLSHKGLRASHTTHRVYNNPKSLEQHPTMGQIPNKYDVNNISRTTQVNTNYGNVETGSRYGAPPVPKKPALDTTTTTQDITQNIINHGSLEDRTHADNIYENVLVALKPRRVTAHATSTALARKDFKLSASQDSSVLADSVVSAVASAEATGENPYIAVARATARAASIATASAAQSASSGDQEPGEHGGDNRDITIMISTSCTIQNGDDAQIQESARGVVKALNSDANVAVYTRLAPAPKALLSKDQTLSNNVRRLKVSIEPNDNGDHDSIYPPQHHTVEIAIPEGLDSAQLSTMVTEAVTRLQTHDSSYDKKEKSVELRTPRTDKGRNQFTIAHAPVPAIKEKAEQEKSTTYSPQNEVNLSINANVPYVAAASYVSQTDRQQPQPYMDKTNGNKGFENKDFNKVPYSKQRPNYAVQNTHGSLGPISDFKANVFSAHTTQVRDQKRETAMTLYNKDNEQVLPVPKRANVTHGQSYVTNFSASTGAQKQYAVNMDFSQSGDRQNQVNYTSEKGQSVGQDYVTKYGANNGEINHRSMVHESMRPNVTDNKQRSLNQAPQNRSGNYSIHEYKYPMNDIQQSPIQSSGNEDKISTNRNNSSNTEILKSTQTHSDRLRIAEYYVTLSAPVSTPYIGNSGQQSGLKHHLDRPLEAPKSPHIQEQWEQLKQSGYSYQRDRACTRTEADATQPIRNCKRDGFYGSLPRTFFTNSGSRTSLVETDLDTGLCKEQPTIVETDLDRTGRSGRAQSYGNLRNPQNTPSTNNMIGTFEKTQSMTCLNDDENGSGDDVTSKTAHASTNSKAHISENELRMNNSLNKLNVPSWYNNATQDGDKLLRNIRRKDIISGEPLYRVASPTLKEGVSARIVTTKPVVIQHRVVTPVMRKSPQPETENFQLPSQKWRQKDGSSFRPIPIKALHDISICREDQSMKMPAKEAYLKLIKNDTKNNDTHLLNSHNYENIPGNALYSEDRDDTPPPLPPRRVPRSPASTTPSSPVFDTGIFYSPSTPPKTVVQINATSAHGQSQPIPNEGGSSYGAIQNGTHSIAYEQTNNNFQAGNSRNTTQEHYNSTGRRHDTPNVSFSDQATSYKTNPSHLTNGPHNPDNIGKYKLDANVESKPNTACISPGTTTTISPDKSTMNMNTYATSRQNQCLNSGQNIRDEPVFDRARHSQNRIVSDFASGIEQKLEIDIVRYDESPKRRRLPTSIDRLKSCDLDDVFQDGGRLNDSRAMETSMDESRANLSLDEILGGLLAVPPSLDTSMVSNPRSRTGSRRHGSSTSSTQSLETPQEKLFRMLRNHSTDMDSTFSKGSSTGDSPDGQSPRGPISPQSAPPRSAVFDNSLDNGEMDDNSVVVKCRNSKCKLQMNLADARHTYKTCHNCFTYYCSRECRKEHWERHKKKCIFSRVSSHCKHVIKQVHSDPALCEEFSKVARTGFIQKGRGCVVVAFSSLERADIFLQNGINVMQFPLAFVSMKEIEESQLFGDQLFELVEMCRTYNPEVKFVMDSVIFAEQPSHGTLPRRESLAVKKCAKLRLTSTQTTQKAGLPQLEENDTLILTAVPGSEFTENMEEKKAREICFANIQRKLRQRGVRLRHQYPEVYNKLCAYVANKEHFAPITLFPVDGNTGKKFMCLIMPNSEPEIEWLNKPDLLEELGLNTEV